MLGHFVEDAELLRLSFCKSVCDIDSLKLPITNLSQAMVHDIVSLLCRLSWVSGNMHNGYEFGIAAGDGTNVGEFARTKSCHDGTDAANSSISVRSIAYIMLDLNARGDRVDLTGI
jgi:hypothetical protein